MGVKVVYSNNCEVFHLTNAKTGEYDAKIDVRPGHTEYYSSKDSSWKEHNHIHLDKNGKATECHGMEKRDWKTTCRS